VVAAVLYALGATRDQVIQEYMLSSDSKQNLIEMTLDGLDKADWPATWSCLSENMCDPEA